jgi:hypothetical protein
VLLPDDAEGELPDESEDPLADEPEDEEPDEVDPEDVEPEDVEPEPEDVEPDEDAAGPEVLVGTAAPECAVVSVATRMPSPMEAAAADAAIQTVPRRTRSVARSRASARARLAEFCWGERPMEDPFVGRPAPVAGRRTRRFSGSL